MTTNAYQIADQNISVLTAFSKISEKLVCARLNKYLMNNSILHDSQYGFREQLSTSMALLKLTVDISKSIFIYFLFLLLNQRAHQATKTVKHAD